MAMPTSTVTVKGQTTIPKQVREYLGIKPNDKLVYTPDRGKVILTPLKGTIRDLKGAFKLPAWEKRPLNFRKLRRVFERSVAENVMRKLQ
jgi:AbrB family looped-hinge helix DNA binding protein